MTQPIQKWLFFLFFSLTSLLMSYGQQRKTFEGPLQIGPYSGKAVYQFIISDLDTVFDGDFSVQNSNLETLLEDEDTSFGFTGFFDEGVANGPWKFQFGEFKTNSQSQVVDYQYRVLVSGRQEIGEGVLKDGKPDGTWTYTINQIKDSEIETTLFKSSMSFDKGVPQQNFQIENDTAVLVGRFLRNGLAHDEWSFYGTETVEDTENWFFDDGLLKRIQVKTDGVSQEIPIFNTNEPDYKIIPLNTGYIALLKDVLEQNENDSHISKLLKQNLGYYQKIEEVLHHLGSEGFENHAQVKVPYYPLDSLQKVTLEEIVSDYKTASKLSSSILENSHLNIVKRTDPDAFFYYNVAVKIKSEFLDPLGTLVMYRENDILQHQKVPVVLQRLWPTGKPDKSIVVVGNEEGGERTFSLPSSEEFAYESNDLLAVAAMGTYAKMSLEYIKGSLSSRLDNDEQLQLLNALEEELIELNAHMERQVDSVNLPAAYDAALAKVKQVSDSALTTYADIEDSNEKLESAEKAKTCLTELKTLTTILTALPQRKEAIKKEYTDAIWNPFMANVMEEEVKKRLIGAYEDILIPYFLNSIAEELTCDNAGDINSQIEQVHQNLMDLRNKDTRKLERKLRREKRPQEILSLLNQRASAKNQ